MLEGGEPGPCCLALSPLYLCACIRIGIRAATVLISSSWGCLHLGLFLPLWHFGQESRMRLKPTALSCPCSFLPMVRARRRRVSAQHGAVWGLPLRGARSGNAEPGNFPSEDSILPPFPGKPHELESDLDPLLRVLVVTFYSTAGQLQWPQLPRDLLPASLLRPGIHIFILNHLSKQPGLG